MDDSAQITSAPPTESRRHGRESYPYLEPALLHYLRLLWKRRLLILAGSLLPALLAALLLSLWPRQYTATFVYERPLTESEYSVLLRRFYSRENLDKIIDRLQAQGLMDYARRLGQTQTEQAFESLIRFDVSPMYPRRLQTTDPATSERISAFQAQLLSIEVRGTSAEEVSDVAAVVTGNFEEILPIYAIRNGLKESIQQFKTLAAEIEDQRFSLLLDLQKEKAKLEKLQALSSGPAPVPEGNLVLQFTDVQGSREFLPLSYQVRALQSKIIDLQETLTSNTEKYGYYLQVLELHGKLLKEVESHLLTDYTVQQFLQFLGEELLACKIDAVSDYLKSYLRKTENLILVNTRAGEQPVVYPAATRLVKGSSLTFVAFLMATMFVAVLLEARLERHPHAGAA